MDTKSIGIIVVIVGGMIVVSNRSTFNQIAALEQRVAHIEEEVLMQASSSDRNIPNSAIDLECLSRNIYYEAGIESTIGKYAVAQVTINRWKEKKPQSLCPIIYAHKKIANGKTVCQFSWACKGKLEKPSGKNWEESKRIAEDVINKGVRVAPLKEATHYHATYVKPNWSEVERVVWAEGSHIFYIGAKKAKTKEKV
jgi:spore germination cell wall hydrolase CwlJ-like protein